MSKEQLDAVKEQLLSEDNSDLRQSVFSAYLEEPERGANMIIAFATDKGLKLEATPSEVVDYLESLDGEDIDIEMTPEMLASVSGGFSKQFTTIAGDSKGELVKKQGAFDYVSKNGQCNMSRFSD